MGLVTLTSDLSRKDISKYSDHLDITSTPAEKIFKIHSEGGTHQSAHLDALGRVGTPDIPQSFVINNPSYTVTGQKTFAEKTDTDSLQKYYDRALNDNDPLGYKNPTHNHRDLLSGGQPFVIRKIGETWSGGDSSAFIDDVTGGFIRGGLATAASRTVADVERVGKFLISGEGVSFLAKQFFLNALNPSIGTKIYNPLSTIISLPPAIRQERHTSLFGFIDGNGRYLKSAGVISRTQKVNSMGGSDVFTPQIAGVQINIPKFISTGGTFENISARTLLGISYVTDLVDKVNLIPYGNSGKIQGKGADDLDLIPFKIQDTTNNKWLIFRSIITGLTDNVTADWNEYKYIGRPDKMWSYQGASRAVSFTLSIFPNSIQELPILWEKVNYLVGLCYPHWTKGELGGNQRMTAPFIKLTMGNLWKNTPGFLTSVNITVNDNSPWEIAQHFKLPKHLEISMDFTYIGNYLPNAVGKQYELDWLSDKSGDGSGTTFANGTKVYRKNLVGKDPKNITSGKDLTKLFKELGE